MPSSPTQAAIQRLTPALGGWYDFERLEGTGEAVWWPMGAWFDGSGFHRPSIVGMARFRIRPAVDVRRARLRPSPRDGDGLRGRGAAGGIPGATVLTPDHGWPPW